jgi:hypothetical protein
MRYVELDPALRLCAALITDDIAVNWIVFFCVFIAMRRKDTILHRLCAAV